MLPNKGYWLSRSNFFLLVVLSVKKNDCRIKICLKIQVVIQPFIDLTVFGKRG